MIKIIKSASTTNSISVIEMTISPHTGNPTHYHTRFDESFEVVEGELHVIHNNKKTILNKGKKLTIPTGNDHSFKNVTDFNCIIRVTLEPGNLEFEQAMLIYYGLKKEGLVHKNGNPKRIKDVAVFIHLNNSNMRGFGKVIAKILNIIAVKAIKKGHLKELINRYVSS